MCGDIPLGDIRAPAVSSGTIVGNDGPRATRWGPHVTGSRGNYVRLRIGLAALAVVLGSAGTAAPGWAGETRTLTGPSTGSNEVFLTYVGCAGFFGPSTAPSSRINLGPQSAPLGRRSLGLVPQGGGTATGPYASFRSLAALDASLSATAAGGSTGVSYIWTITPDTLPGTAWSGRADTAAGAGGWQEVRTADLTYTWSLVDLTSRRPVADGGQATPAQFAAAHGDGHGYVVTGFGCDGNAFNIDAVRSGATTWDFEGITLSTTMGAAPASVQPGATVTISGTVRDTGGRVTGDPLVLEARTPGGEWRPLGDPRLADRDGTTRLDVVVDETTEYRWHRPESQYADEGWSDAVTVRVEAPAPAPAPSSPETPAPEGAGANAGDKAGAKGGGTGAGAGSQRQ